MNKTIMYYVGQDVADMFDATQWFNHVVYRSRNIEADGSASYVTMRRNQPAKLSAKPLEELPFMAAGSF